MVLKLGRLAVTSQYEQQRQEENDEYDSSQSKKQHHGTSTVVGARARQFRGSSARSRT